MTPTFVRIGPHEWHLNPEVHGSRRKRLLHGAAFVEIVRRIAAQAVVLNHKRARVRKRLGYSRAEVTLEVEPGTVDLFHNSAAGYRAQYYHSVRIGEAANRYAVQQLAERAIVLLAGVQKRNCPLWWLESSLLHSEAKVWIHQGPWLRLARRSDRNLRVGRWLNSNPQKTKRRVWATLTPASETRIDLKGAPLTLDGRRCAKGVKRDRTKDIHEVGYT